MYIKYILCSKKESNLVVVSDESNVRTACQYVLQSTLQSLTLNAF